MFNTRSVAGTPTYQTLVEQSGNAPNSGNATKNSFLDRIKSCIAKCFEWVINNPYALIGIAGLSLLTVTVITTGQLHPFLPIVSAMLVVAALGMYRQHASKCQHQKAQNRVETIETNVKELKGKISSLEKEQTFDEIKKSMESMQTVLKEFQTKIKSQDKFEGLLWQKGIKLTESLDKDYQDRFAKLDSDPKTKIEAEKVLHSYHDFACRTRIEYFFRADELIADHKLIAEYYRKKTFRTLGAN